jgi:sialate O-acetylesterase
VKLKNVLIGDVWICSGQSNMAMGIGVCRDGKKEIAAADHPKIRLYTIPNWIATEPQDQIWGNWNVCSPDTVGKPGWGGFSAAGYYFGRHLQKNTGIPIGLIHTSWGGTPIRSWISQESLRTVPGLAKRIDEFNRQVAEFEKADGDFPSQMARWWKKNDAGSGTKNAWSSSLFDDSAWKTMSLPALWKDVGLGDFDGVVWYRKTVDLPDTWTGQELSLNLGPIDDEDTTWFNGVKVGNTARWDRNRKYGIPADLVRRGSNVIAVRVLDTNKGGGIYGKPKQLSLSPAKMAKGVSPLSLAGSWKFMKSSALADMTETPKDVRKSPHNVSVLYNSMVSPLIPFAIKGAIWYQGESDSWQGDKYRVLLPALIEDWRSRFESGTFPFLIVQLANYMKSATVPSESAWAELREAQTLVSRTVPRTGLAVIIDVGEANDIHPRNKHDVGKRLALAARAMAYGHQIEYSGPLYRDMRVEGNKIRLRFYHVGDGLVAKGGKELKGFAIAGKDGEFVWADAAIDGADVVVSAKTVKKPVAVRYAWANNPVCNLYNKAGLPASPFRTDSPIKLH